MGLTEDVGKFKVAAVSCNQVTDPFAAFQSDMSFNVAISRVYIFN